MRPLFHACAAMAQPIAAAREPDVPASLMQRLLIAAGLALGLYGLSALFTNAAFAQSAASTSAARGLAIYKAKCSACHALNDNGVGPAHTGVVGRRVAQVKNYDYSEALAKSNLVWTRANLERWLTDPERLIPGQRMGYRLASPQERSDVIVYLASLSSTQK